MLYNVYMFSTVHEENANTLVTDGQRLQKAVTYTILPGVRLNSQIYIDNLSYRYYKNVRRNNKMWVWLIRIFWLKCIVEYLIFTFAIICMHDNWLETSNTFDCTTVD